MTYTTIKLRRGSAAQWTAENPTLALGEYGYETDTRKSKVGTGSTTWNSLPYVYTGPEIHVDDYGADPTGDSLSNSAVTAALAVMGDSPGTLSFGPGTYRLSTTISLDPGQSVRGAGDSATVIEYTGNSDCIRLHDSRSWSSGNPMASFPPNNSAGAPGFGGSITALTINGTEAGSGACGIHTGDIVSLSIEDVIVYNFTSGTGIWFDNQHTWTESAEVRAWVQNCQTGYLFDGNTDHTGFLYNKFDFNGIWYANQKPVVLRSGAQIGSSEIRIRGNCTAGSMPDIFAATTNNSAMLTVGVSSGSPGRITMSRLQVSVECGGGNAATPSHRTIDISANSSVDNCNGLLHFGYGGADWANGNHYNKLWFSGVVNAVGDETLGRSMTTQGLRSIGFMAGNRGYMSPTGAIALGGGNWFFQTMTAGAQTITVDTGTADPTVSGQYDIFVKQPASGSTTLTWPAGWVWAEGQAPQLSTTNNAVDWIRVTFVDFGTVFAQHVNTKVITGKTISSSTLSGPKVDTLFGMSSGHAALEFSDTASAVNHLKVYNSAASSGPSLEAVGQDANIPINIAAKAAGKVEIYASALRLNEVAVPTISSVSTLSYKTLDTPKILGGSGTATISAGTGSPESVVTATVGSLYMRTDGGAATTLYVKESGTGNTGWAAK